jgi:hypothetical protein
MDTINFLQPHQTHVFSWDVHGLRCYILKILLVLIRIDSNRFTVIKKRKQRPRLRPLLEQS